MLSFGLDYVTGPPVAALKAANVTFVCRYLSFVNEATKVKLLTLAEARANGQAGIATVSNYEWYANRALEGAVSGKQDAQIAASQHAECGGPPDRPIYFSVDADVAGAQVADYFRGVASFIGLARTGAYGSYQVIKYLFDNHLISWGWQTYAWSGGQWEPRAHIRQYQNGITLAGASVDYDEAMTGDFGQWIPQTAERTTWVSTHQEQQAEAYWNSTTAGSIPAGGNAPVAVGIFPAGHAPNYGTGIARAWQGEYKNGHVWGPPTTYEFDKNPDGTPLTDWNGNLITCQMFMGGRCEWNKSTHKATWYAWP